MDFVGVAEELTSAGVEPWADIRVFLVPGVVGKGLKFKGGLVFKCGLNSPAFRTECQQPE
jgi:hypothetical protein